MTTGQSAFRQAFAERARTFASPVAFDDDGACVLDIDGTGAVVLQDVPAQDSVLIWAVITGLPEDEHSADRARFLLERQDCGRETAGFFSYALDPDSRRLVLQGFLDYARLSMADEIGVMLETFLEVVDETRKELAARWPSDADADVEWMEDDE